MNHSDDWIPVYATDMLYKAEIVKQILIDNNIMAFVLNKKDSFYQFGDIEVCVQPANVMRAKHIVNKVEL
jgi:hypothetical protein